MDGYHVKITDHLNPAYILRGHFSTITSKSGKIRGSNEKYLFVFGIEKNTFIPHSSLGSAVMSISYFILLFNFACSHIVDFLLKISSRFSDLNYSRFIRNCHVDRIPPETTVNLSSVNSCALPHQTWLYWKIDQAVLCYNLRPIFWEFNIFPALLYTHCYFVSPPSWSYMCPLTVSLCMKKAIF